MTRTLYLTTNIFYKPSIDLPSPLPKCFFVATNNGGANFFSIVHFQEQQCPLVGALAGPPTTDGHSMSFCCWRYSKMIEQTCGEQPNIPGNLRLHNNSDTTFFDVHNDEPKLEKNASSNITAAELLVDNNANNKDKILNLCPFMASSR